MVLQYVKSVLWDMMARNICRSHFHICIVYFVNLFVLSALQAQLVNC